MSTLTSSVAATAKEAVTTKVSAETTRLVAEAQTRAADIRKDAQALADKVKSEGNRQADSLVAKSSGNPLLQLAAKPAAEKLRKQADDKATGIVAAANARADSLVAAAQRQGDKAKPEVTAATPYSAQRHDGIDARRASRRCETRDRRDDREKHRHRDEGDRVARRDAEEQRRHESRGGERDDEAEIVPCAASTNPGRNASFRMSACVAPSAWRRPNSCPRWPTRKAITP